MHVHLILPDAEEFPAALADLYGRVADDVLRAALPYSVIARNDAEQAIALLGIRFDMVGMKGNKYSVVHYADTLRNPQQAVLKQGAMRFVCAEPAYTELVLRAKGEVSARARMNLDNLRRVLRIQATVDCVAFDDGRFEGVDSRGAFERLERERLSEMAFVDEVLGRKSGARANLETLLAQALEAEEIKALARRLYEGFEAGGEAEVATRARSHRCRIKLIRIGALQI